MPLNNSDSHSTHPKVVKPPSTTWFAGYCSAPLASNLHRVQPVYRLCWQSPTHPACSPQSTKPALWAASAGPGGPSNIRTPTNLEMMLVRYLYRLVYISILVYTRIYVFHPSIHKYIMAWRSTVIHHHADIPLHLIMYSVQTAPYVFQMCIYSDIL